MKRVAILSLFVSAVLLDVRAADACSCAPAATACAAYWRLDAMFTGTVIAIEPAPASAPGTRIVRFAVTQRGRGITGDSATLYVTPQDGSNCGYSFRIGETYVVRAHAAAGGRLTTTMCSGTRPASQATEDVAFLREVSGPRQGGRVFGQVGLVEHYGLMPDRPDRGPVGGAQIRVVGERIAREVMTGPNGRFEIRDLPAGTYQVSFIPPPGVGLPGPPLPPEERVSPGPWSVTLNNPFECSQFMFRVRTDAQLTGTVLAPDGSPAVDERVDLIAVSQARRAEREVPHVSAFADSEGRFTFAFLAPGRYLVGINLANPPAPEFVDRRAYYPGVNDVSRATVVSVTGPGERVELAPLRLPSPPAERVIDGVVVWPDGRPAAGATLELMGAITERQVTADGRFRYVLPYGAQYSITARSRTPDGKTAVSGIAMVDREARDRRIEIPLRVLP